MVGSQLMLEEIEGDFVIDVEVPQTGLTVSHIGIA